MVTRSTKFNRIVFLVVMIITFLIAGLKIGYSQSLVDTNSKYAKGMPFGIGKNDCSVRALATINNLDYIVSHRTLRSLGRNDNSGFDSRVLLQYFKGMDKLDSIENIKSKKLTSRKLIKKNKLNLNYDYLALSSGHIFALKHNGNDWVVYGNSDDLDSKVNYLVKINKTNNYE